MHPEILGEIADARLVERRREAALARRVLAARRAGPARDGAAAGGRVRWWSRVMTVWGRHPDDGGRALRPGVRGAR